MAEAFWSMHSRRAYSAVVVAVEVAVVVTVDVAEVVTVVVPVDVAVVVALVVGVAVGVVVDDVVGVVVTVVMSHDENVPSRKESMAELRVAVVSHRISVTKPEASHPICPDRVPRVKADATAFKASDVLAHGPLPTGCVMKVSPSTPVHAALKAPPPHASTSWASAATYASHSTSGGTPR